MRDGVNIRGCQEIDSPFILSLWYDLQLSQSICLTDLRKLFRDELRL